MYKWVSKYIGIPFVSNGRAAEGCDCYGLVRLVLRNEYGIDLPLLSNDYNDSLNVEETKKLFAEHRPVLLAQKLTVPREKAVVILKERGAAAHIGIFAGNGYILHTGIKTGCICQRETHPALRGRMEGYYSVS